MVANADAKRIDALTKRNRDGAGLRPLRASRHLTKEEEIREIYAMETRTLYGVREAALWGWRDFEIGGVAGRKGVG